MAIMTSSQVLLPGDTISAISQSSKVAPGLGTFLSADRSSIIASKAGNPANPPKASFISVNEIPRTSYSPPASLPAVGDVVIARVTRTTNKQAHVDILALTSLDSPSTLTFPLPYVHQALIRQQDIRATEIDKVTVLGSFRVNDIVRALVISIGDERNYYLSTAKNEFGVLLGWSAETDRELIGVNWGEMVEVETGRKELRKVAKIV